MDPFAGSSTTGVAAIRLKRKFVGTELSSEFLSLSLNRLEQEINRLTSLGVAEESLQQPADFAY